MTFVFMINHMSSNEKQTDMWYQIASSASNHRTKFVGFTLQTCDFPPLTRWHCKLRKGITGLRIYMEYSWIKVIYGKNVTENHVLSNQSNKLLNSVKSKDGTYISTMTRSKVPKEEVSDVFGRTIAGITKAVIRIFWFTSFLH